MPNRDHGDPAGSKDLKSLVTADRKTEPGRIYASLGVRIVCEGSEKRKSIDLYAHLRAAAVSVSAAVYSTDKDLVSFRAWILNASTWWIHLVFEATNVKPIWLLSFGVLKSALEQTWARKDEPWNGPAKPKAGSNQNAFQQSASSTSKNPSCNLSSFRFHGVQSQIMFWCNWNPSRWWNKPHSITLPNNFSNPQNSLRGLILKFKIEDKEFPACFYAMTLWVIFMIRDFTNRNIVQGCFSTSSMLAIDRKHCVWLDFATINPFGRSEHFRPMIPFIE